MREGGSPEMPASPNAGDPVSTNFARVSKPTLPDLVVRAIKERIERGELKPDDRLPAEPVLAESFDVGRSTIREALKALTILGLIRRSNAGTFIADPPMIAVGRESAINEPISPGTVERLFRARLMLEPGIAGVAAQSATSEDISGLEATVERMRSTAAIVSNMSADLDFHHRLTLATHDPILIRLGSQLHTDFAICHKAYEKIWDEGETRAWGIDNHERIIGALRAKDHHMAETEVRRVLSESYDRLQTVLGLSDSHH